MATAFPKQQNRFDVGIRPSKGTGNGGASNRCSAFKRDVNCRSLEMTSTSWQFVSPFGVDCKPIGHQIESVGSS